MTPRTPRPEKRRWPLWVALVLTLALLFVRYDPLQDHAPSVGAPLQTLQMVLQISTEMLHRMIGVLFVPGEIFLTDVPDGMADPVGLALTAALKHDPEVCDAMRGIYGVPLISNSLLHRCERLAAYDTQTLSTGFTQALPVQLLWTVFMFLVFLLDH